MSTHDESTGPAARAHTVEQLCRHYADVGRAVWGRERATRRSRRRRRGPAGVSAVGYAWVRRPDEAGAPSLEEQRREIARYCAQRRYELVRVETDVGLRRLMRSAILVQADDGAFDFDFDLVVVASLDRWDREGSLLATLMRLGHADAGFASVEEGLDFTLPTGRLLLTCLDTSEFSPTLNSRRPAMLRERVERGIAPGPVPFGYRKRPSGHLIVIPEEGEAVVEAFRRRARGESYGAIARWLNGRGLRTRGRSGGFTSFAVRDLLTNVVYRGGIRYRGDELPGAHRALVDDELFGQVQARLGAPRARRTPVGDRGVLQGRISCWRCSLPLERDRGKAGRPIYRVRGSRCSRGKHWLHADVIDEQVDAIWRSLPFPASWRRRMAESLAAEHDRLVHEALFRSARAITGGRRAGAVDERPYALRLAIMAERAPELVPSAEGPSPGEAAQLFSDMSALWERARNPERRELIAPLIESVYVDIDAKRIVDVQPTREFDPWWNPLDDDGLETPDPRWPYPW